MSHLSLIYTLVETLEDAKRLANCLITSHTAACVNIIPGIFSMYEWQGKVQESQEIALIIKTTPNMMERAMQMIKENHPYEIPAISVLQTIDTDDAFFKWVENQVC